MTCVQRVHVGAAQFAFRHSVFFCFFAGGSQIRPDLCHGVSFLECLSKAAHLGFCVSIGGLTAADRRRRNHGKVVRTDPNQTFQVVEKDAWKSHRARKPPAVSL